MLLFLKQQITKIKSSLSNRMKLSSRCLGQQSILTTLLKSNPRYNVDLNGYTKTIFYLKTYKNSFDQVVLNAPLYLRPPQPNINLLNISPLFFDLFFPSNRATAYLTLLPLLTSSNLLNWTLFPSFYDLLLFPICLQMPL